jgi:hypothetical protein
MAELHAAIFIASAIVVSYGINMGAYWQAGGAAALFVFWNAVTAGGSKSKRTR